MTQYPLAIPALLFAAGIVTGSWLQPPWPVMLGGAVGAWLLAWWSKSRIALAALLFLSGWAGLVAHTTPLNPADLRHAIGDSARLATVRGTLAEAPATRLVRRGEVLQARSHCIVNVSALKLAQWQGASGKIVVWAPEELPDHWLPGSVVEVEGVLQPPRASAAPGLFNYRKNLAWKGIHHTLNAESARDVRLISDSDAGLWAKARRGFIGWTKRTLSRGFAEDDETVRLLWAMTLGWTTALTEEVSEPLVRTGTLHVFAISGMHVALITAVIAITLRVLRVPRSWSAVMATSFLWFYTFATGFQPSAVRSAIMGTVLLHSWSVKRPSNLVNSLCAAALLILALEPRELFHAGFQLSFLVVLALAIITPPLMALHEARFRPDPLLAEQARTWTHRWAWRAERWGALLAAGTVAAWIGSAPISAYYFNVLSPVALLANLVIVPLSNGALITCFLSLLVSPIWGWGGEVFNNAAHAFMTSMLWFADISAAWRWSAFNVRAPSFAAMVLLYGIVFGVALKVWTRPRLACASAIGLIICLAAVALNFHRGSRLFSATILPGDGSGIFLQDGRRNALIDCGSAYAAERLLKPFLRAQGINRLGAIVLTHGDAQHVGGLKIVAESFRPQSFVTSGASFRSRVYRDQVAFAEGLGLRVITSTQQISGTWGHALFPPPNARSSRADDAAVTLKLQRHGRAILLLGDLGRSGQAELLASGQDLKADVLALSRSADTHLLLPELLESVQPAVVVFSGSLFGSQLPEKLLQAQVIRTGARFFNTEESGAITIAIRPDGGMELTPVNDEAFLVPPAH